MSKKYNIDKFTLEYGKSKMAQTKKNANTKSSAKSKTKVRAKETQNTEPKKNTGAASEIIGVVLICVGVLFGIAAYTSISALLIKWIKHLTFGLFGVMGYFAPVAIAAVGVLFIIYGKRSKKAFKVLMSVLGVLSVLSANSILLTKRILIFFRTAISRGIPRLSERDFSERCSLFRCIKSLTLRVRYVYFRVFL